MLTKNIEFKNFKISLNNIKIKNELKIILNIQTEILKSLKPSYKYSYSKRILNKLKKKLIIPNNWHGWIYTWGRSYL